MLRKIFFALICLAAAASSFALEWSTTEIQLLRSNRFREPNNPNKVTKDVLTIQHADGYSLGRNFFFIDFMKSGHQELDLAGRRESPSEIYGEAYTTLSLSRLTGESFSAGIVRDLGLTAGIKGGSKRSQLHPRPRTYLAGFTVDFAVPKGFFNVDVLAYSDHGCYIGISDCPAYRDTYQVLPNWNFPFSVGGIDGEFAGFVEFIGSRGAGTVAQVLSQPQLRFDIGKPLFGSKGSLYAGIEYQYWRNKLGEKGVDETHPQLLVLWKF